MDVLFWEQPVGISADVTEPLLKRAMNYYENHNTRIKGQLITPDVETVYLILQSYDTFGAPLVIEEDSYFIKGKKDD